MVSKNRADAEKNVTYLKEWRDALGFKIDEIAARTNTGYQFVQGRETGRRQVLLEDIVVFQRAYLFNWTLLMVPPPNELEALVMKIRETLGNDGVESLLRVLAYVASPPPPALRNDTSDD